MDIADLLPWLTAASTLVSLSTAAYVGLTRPAKVAGEAVRGVEERMTAVERRLESIPDRDAVHRMELAVASLEGRLATLDSRLTSLDRSLGERLQPIAATTQRLQEWLLEAHR